MSHLRVSRRKFLIGSAAVIVAGLTGCTKEAREEIAAPLPPQVPPRAPNPAQPAQPKQPIRPAYTIISSESWGMRKPTRPLDPLGVVHKITVHHTGEYNAWVDKSDLQIVKSIENGHTAADKTRRKVAWPCIGYHYIVGTDGSIFACCPADKRGTHTRSDNSNNLGISVIGDFSAAPPSAIQLRALEAFLNDQRRALGLARTQVFGHRDSQHSKGNQCPGNALYAWLQQYKKKQDAV